MFAGDSSSQHPSHRNHTALSQAPALPPIPVDSQPSLQQGSLPVSRSWPIHRPPIPGASPYSLHSHHSPSHASQSASLLDSQTPLAGTVTQSSLDHLPPKEEPNPESSHGLGITSYPMSVASSAYFAGPMQQNSHHYVWANRPFPSLQPPTGHMNPPYQPSHPYPSSGFSVGYNGQHGAPLPSYQQDSHPAPASYLAAAPGHAPRQTHSRSPSLARPFHPHSAPGTPPLSDQSLMTSSSPYMMNQPAYYMPEAQSIPTSNQSSMSSQAPSMVAADQMYSSPDSVPPTEPEHQVRVISSRPRPQCWDHGCNGREFSTFSNLLRHQREKSGVVAKAECPICGAVFTRTTARNIHVAQGKCKSSGRESSTE
ncbi:hypothetical protein NUU61_009859 [Penicillium alfredii]|uniref:C2H2-type domain-containing protein n=1 Tax=Penicillium alfredii TaxID=1506179 RepID=A0A9W9EH32_9EURO|nr:uncharacterized protein NUU61_009859 [Penicillium alfredii]KAJ5081595.1 hypothetical protein NUU61_009859 [Penicillium alfredii]